MKLSGPEILKRIQVGDITISPFHRDRLNPNSYNLALSSRMLVYKYADLDMAEDNETKEVHIPATGLLLQPGKIYLGCTEEYTETFGLVPCIEGRSSIGRLGINIHSTAGFGDVGFCGCWTLEISTVQPVRIYAGVQICQIAYDEICGDIEPYRSNKGYDGQREPRASGIWRELQKEQG